MTPFLPCLANWGGPYQSLAHGLPVFCLVPGCTSVLSLRRSLGGDRLWGVRGQEQHRLPTFLSSLSQLPYLSVKIGCDAML